MNENAKLTRPQRLRSDDEKYTVKPSNQATISLLHRMLPLDWQG